mgnify:CR=1 FL=1
MWMKFNDHNPLITKCCDKYAVKEYVKNIWYDNIELNVNNL